MFFNKPSLSHRAWTPPHHPSVPRLPRWDTALSLHIGALRALLITLGIAALDEPEEDEPLGMKYRAQLQTPDPQARAETPR